MGSSLLSSARKVQYRTDHPDMSLYDPSTSVWHDALLFTKADPWSYEEEYRCIDPDGPGLKDFGDSELTGIIFGCEMSEVDREEVRQWLSEQSSSIDIYEARRVRRKFRLDVVPMTA